MSVSRIKTTFPCSSWPLMSPCHVRHVSNITYLHCEHAYMIPLYACLENKSDMLDTHITFGYACPKTLYPADMYIVFQNAFPFPASRQIACWTCNLHNCNFETCTLQNGHAIWKKIACSTCNISWMHVEHAIMNHQFQTWGLRSWHGGVVSCGHAYYFRTCNLIVYFFLFFGSLW